MSQFQLSDKVRELITKSRIVSFINLQDVYPIEVMHCLQAADDQGRYLTDADLQQIQELAPELAKFVPIVQLLRDRVNDIIDEARAEVLQAFPQITQEGGGLYPAERANACWRDFWHFLRCITYGITEQRTDYLSTEGLQYMNLLYQELQVPLDAMVVGLEGIKTASLKRLDSEQKFELPPYFDCLIEQLKMFI
ncbi:phycobilisome protein [Pseudanabaena sp. UWO311]|uniref:phycobilisome protein n=1 Tax=Pseudanabaena sp. UWO311 TaxID=2487337 RepID=UPI001158DB0B|nr:phycobilisome protein [Pseudanabaena sp. UWO311]TYQ28615.1 phycobilisome protein [Pseudanabaena sp. UWO311]